MYCRCGCGAIWNGRGRGWRLEGWPSGQVCFCGSELAREKCMGIAFLQAARVMVLREQGECVHIRCCGNGEFWFRPYGGSLSKSAKVTKALSPLTYGASLWLDIPSLRSCSVGPSPSAIHGRGRLTRHPCRVAHCAKPALSLPTGQVKIKIKSRIKSQSQNGVH